jgi:hypothetical protein
MATLLFQLVILAALVLMAILPIALFILLIENWRNWRKSVPLAVTAMALAGFLIGGAIGWACRPDAWQMPLWQTAEASVNSEKYGHPIEPQAERVLLYFLFSGVLGAAAAALAAPWIIRYSTTGRPPSGSSASASGTCT